MAQHTRNRFRDTYAPLLILGGDIIATAAGLSLGFWLRYKSDMGGLGVDVPNASFPAYAPLLLLGASLLIGTFANLGLYDSRQLLRKFLSLNLILKGVAFWLVAYLGVSLVLKFTPPISRLFAIIACLCVLLCLSIWRAIANAAFASPRLRKFLQRRIALLGWNANASSMVAEISRDAAHPFAIAGVIALPGDLPPPSDLQLGEVAKLSDILREHSIDLLIATRVDLRRMELRQIVESCERAYVDWKIVPAAFDIFLNGLRLQTIGRTPVLGIEDLPITKLFNRLIKRGVDIVGGLVGLILSLPAIAVLAVLIKRESPDGSVVFSQLRVGTSHQPFKLYKLRSMRPDAAKTDDERQSTAHGDPRLLRIGVFMRRWNLDELPQFWNVLRGDMSLAGPRPERPFHVDQLSAAIPHYLPRHLAKPGMTGWAQINGFRGNSSIELRVQYDIYYIENWSLWLDLQILLLTFVRWKNVY